MIRKGFCSVLLGRGLYNEGFGYSTNLEELGDLGNAVAID